MARRGARGGKAPREAVSTQGRANGSPGTEDTLHLRLSGSPEAAASARRALARLRSDLDPPLMETMRLLVTELVSNSVKHAQAGHVQLKAVVGRSAVWIEVLDEGPGFDPDKPRTPGKDAGWGLFLVERLANRWGVVQDGASTRVWFELRRG
jgi:anti-sigma regulatory factor (Ser/Thr protein kinase)